MIPVAAPDLLNLSLTPGSVYTVTPDDIEALQLRSTEDILRRVPGIFVGNARCFRGLEAGLGYKSRSKLLTHAACTGCRSMKRPGGRAVSIADGAAVAASAAPDGTVAGSACRRPAIGVTSAAASLSGPFRVA